MLYIELHHHSKSVNCDYCGTINNHNINAQLINNGEIIKEFSFLHEPHHSGNWSGKMMDVYIHLSTNLVTLPSSQVILNFTLMLLTLNLKKILIFSLL